MHGRKQEQIDSPSVFWYTVFDNICLCIIPLNPVLERRLAMRISIGPRPEMTVRPEIKGRRPPGEYIDLLVKSESEFRNYIRDIESNPGFQKMISEGWVKKVHFKGRIPHHLYQEFQDREFVEFLNKYAITNKIDWETDFFHKDARQNSRELAAKYDVPRGELIKSLEYCRHLRLSWNGYEEKISDAFLSLDEPGKFRPPEASDMLAQSDESLTELSDLMERYEISEADFVEHFLSEGADSFEIARELDMDVNAAEDILETLEKVHILSSMQVNVVSHPESGSDPEPRSVAVIKRLKNPPRAEIQIDGDEQYGFRYDVEEPDCQISKEEAALLEKLKLINQRRTLIFRIISFIYESQYPYFVSGNELYLKPLSQAQISREVGEHESTISRILKNRSLETPEGVLPLKFFCQSKKEIIERIIQIKEKTEIESGVRDKPFSDAEIANILEKQYNAKISRRTVTYYRNKLAETPKFYTRKKKRN